MVQIQSAESICYNVLLALDIAKFGTVFFEYESPAHDALSIKSLVAKVLMVGVDYNLVT